MITDEEFKKHIEIIGANYEDCKDYIHSNIDFRVAGDLLDKLSNLRHVACIALRESHTTKNPGLN